MRSVCCPQLISISASFRLCRRENCATLDKLDWTFSTYVYYNSKALVSGLSFSLKRRFNGAFKFNIFIGFILAVILSFQYLTLNSDKMIIILLSLITLEIIYCPLNHLLGQILLDLFVPLIEQPEDFIYSTFNCFSLLIKSFWLSFCIVTLARCHAYMM